MQLDGASISLGELGHNFNGYFIVIVIKTINITLYYLFN